MMMMMVMMVMILHNNFLALSIRREMIQSENKVTDLFKILRRKRGILKKQSLDER